MKRNVESGALNDQSGLAEMLNDSSIDRVMAIDLQWNIISWNKTSEILSGITKNEVLGKNLLEAFPQILSDEEMLNAINNGFEGRKSFLPSNLKSYNRYYAENHFIPLRDYAGNVIGVMNIMHDVGHRIKAEKQLEKLNAELKKKYQQLEKANRELANFTYITSRDIKEPLKHVYTSLELLIKKEAGTLSNASKGNLRRMQGSLNKMNLLLDDILTVSSISDINEPMQQVDLNHVLHDAEVRLKDKIQEKNAIIRAGELPEVMGYKKMLDFLFVNLIDNAVKFQEESAVPEIDISTGLVTGRDSGVRDLIPDKNYLRISFKDNGIGFDPSDADRIFNLFERLNDRQYHGSGIGLTICRKIVEFHDGMIEAKSSSGAGATFNCYIPLEEDVL